MKLISRGDLPLKTAQFTCANCGSVWEADYHDGSITADRDGIAHVLSCQCGAQTWIAESEFK